MQPFRYHVFVCSQQKAEGVPCCSTSGSSRVLDALHKELGAQSLADEVQVSSCGCLGLCDDGPVMIVYPEGTWYARVTPADVPELVTSHFLTGQKVARLQRDDYAEMRDEILDHRSQYLAMLKAKDAAGVLPDDLNEMIRAFMPSRVILTAIELDVFRAISDGTTAAEVAAKIEADVRATETLLNALVSLNLVEKHDGLYKDAPIAARFLAGGSPDDVRTAQLHTVNMWLRWSSLTEVVKSGAPVSSGRSNGWINAFIAAMDQNARGRARAMAQAIELNGARQMLDLGGGSGAYSIALVRSSPSLHSDILDLPEVSALTRDYVEKAGVGDRIHVLPGDMLATPLQAGHYDLVLLSAVCHMFSPSENRELLQRACAALAPKGRVVISDFILETDKTAPRSAALFSLNMLVGTPGGASYSEAEYRGWLQDAGFREPKRVRMPGPANLMIATRS